MKLLLWVLRPLLWSASPSPNGLLLPGCPCWPVSRSPPQSLRLSSTLLLFPLWSVAASPSLGRQEGATGPTWTASPLGGAALCLKLLEFGPQWKPGLPPTRPTHSLAALATLLILFLLRSPPSSSCGGHAFPLAVPRAPRPGPNTWCETGHLRRIRRLQREGKEALPPRQRLSAGLLCGTAPPWSALGRPRGQPLRCKPACRIQCHPSHYYRRR